MTAVEAPFLALLRDCNARYRGRARADQFGAVLAVLAKDDHSVVVHDLQENVSPQFYNPGDDLSVWTRLDRLYIRSTSPDGEELRVNGLPEFVREVGEYESPGKPARRQVRGLEGDVVDWILEDPSVLGIGGAEVKREEDRTGGRVDLYLGDGTVVEVKRKALVGSLDQARRYLRDTGVSEVVIACLEASETLEGLVADEEDISLRLLDKQRFEAFVEKRRETGGREW